jgi:hypothetical protein
VEDTKPTLKIAWASYDAAKYACLNWHYSGTLPVGRLVRIGAWEDDRYIGCVIFSHGANCHIGEPYGLNQQECVELTRVALCDHSTFVSEILAKSIRMLKKFCPGLRLIVSYADSDQGHTGGIYQATNWIFTGKSEGERYFMLHGKKIHPKTLYSKGYKQSLPWLKKYINADYSEFTTNGKYKYLFPLDKKMREQVMRISKPYPKKRYAETTSD